MTFDDKYEIRTFPAALADGEADTETSRWAEAVDLGFHSPRITDAAQRFAIEGMVADDSRLTGVYARRSPEHSLDSERPVGTYISFDKTLNIGYGQLLDAHLITSVTVRPTHRRQGILRRMMTADLAGAKAAGKAMAVLTVSEATIYGRFGFGPATWEHSIRVGTGERFGLRTRPTGHVEMTDPAALEVFGPGVFERFHANSPGSIGRRSRHWCRVSGRVGDEGEPDRSVRAAAHYDEEGRIDGYVSYKFAGWDATPPTVKVIDLVAADAQAYMGLWEYLGSLDLVERVEFRMAPVSDPLRAALTDPRQLEVTEVGDVLWLRVLDPLAALGARRYGSDGRLALRIHDSLGLAEGTFELTVTGGVGQVRAVEDSAAELTLDVSRLGSIFLGGFDPITLRDAGGITEHAEGAAQRARALFATERPPYGVTHF